MRKLKKSLSMLVMVAAQIVVAMVCLACLSTSSFGAFKSLEPDLYDAGTVIPSSGAYMRYWSASITSLLTTDGHFTDSWARDNFMSHYTYSVTPVYVNPSTYERVYGYTASPYSSVFDGATMHILFGTYSKSQNQFNFQPTNFVSIDVLWPTLYTAATYVDMQAFSANNTLLGSYRYYKGGSGSFTRMALSLSGIARVAIVPPQADSTHDQFGLDWMNFIDSNTGTFFDLTTYGTIKAPDAVTLANSDSLTGTGTITGSLINNGGTISPGHSAGTITVEGQFSQSPDGRTVMEVGAESDQIIVSQVANLAGTLEIDLLEDFDFLDGDIFTLMTYLSHSGEFDNVLGLVFDGGFFDLTYGTQALTLTAHSTASTVPIPGAGLLLGSALLLGSGLLQLPIYSRRRKSASSS